VDAKSYAGFANATVHATDGLNINAGLRYTHESKVYNYSRLPVGGSLVLGLDSLNGNPGRYSGSKLDYRLNVDYRWSDALMTYASVSTAFKGGGTNARPFGPGQVVPFDKEKLTAYEIGAKTDFFDRRLRVNVAGFVNKYKDIQLTLLTCPSLTPVAPCAATFNAGDADIKGYEIEIEAQPTEKLRLDASFSDLSFKYTRLQGSTGLTVGQEAPGTIKLKWSIGAQYEGVLANGATLTPRFDYSFQGGFNTNAQFTGSNRVAGHHLGNARLTYKAPESSWEVAAIASNVFDKSYYISNFDLLSSSGAQYGLLAPPREFSIQVQKKFCPVGSGAVPPPLRIRFLLRSGVLLLHDFQPGIFRLQNLVVPDRVAFCRTTPHSDEGMAREPVMRASRRLERRERSEIHFFGQDDLLAQSMRDALELRHDLRPPAPDIAACVQAEDAAVLFLQQISRVGGQHPVGPKQTEVATAARQGNTRHERTFEVATFQHDHATITARGHVLHLGQGLETKSYFQCEFELGDEVVLHGACPGRREIRWPNPGYPD
jgi:hypothetical protein